jgi:NADPH-dependent 2,4-dienoyl-CoA reductase/sulfur reductase-like enzyme/nitrite reductase/ring-hydroxylating ferredoxin subunit
MGGSNELTGPDLERGVAASDLKEGGTLLGHAFGANVLLVRSGKEVFAVGATCTHYGGPLAEGLVVRDTVRCPWHHACFSLRTGEALRAPALSSIARFDVELRGDKIHVVGKKSEVPAKAKPASSPAAIVIVGGGAAGHAAAEVLRREGYDGNLTMLSADAAPPVDRPNLSKDYLAGNAPEEWIPLRPPEFYAEHAIDLVLDSRVTEIDVAGKRVRREGAIEHPFDALLLATGAVAIPLGVPGGDLPHVHTLRTLRDSRAIIADLPKVKRAVVVGSSFIGLEVAAALRARNVDVTVVSPEARPLERVLGPEIGDAIRALHEEKGVTFRLGHTVKFIDAYNVTLNDDDLVPADLVVVGIGVRPVVDLAEKANLALDRGVAVDEFLQTSAPGVYAAGDIARWPDPHSGGRIRVEHWVVAERLGQIAARNMLGQRVKCDVVPFFWSQHYDLQISYVGHAEKWDRLDIDGSIAERDCRVLYRAGGKTLAVVTIGRDRQSLEAELAFETES